MQRNDLEPLPSTSPLVRLNYWALTHFSALRRTGIVGLAAVCVALYGWSAWRAIPILQDPKLVDRIAAEVAAMRPFVPQPPTPLELGEVEAVEVPGSTQLVATISNPNDDRLALDVAYEFRTPDGRAVASGQTWLMPGETRYAAGAAAGEAGDAQLVVTHRRWVRQQQHDPVPPLGLAVRDVRLVSEGGQPVRATFTVENGDGVGYRTVQATAVARSGGVAVAVGKLPIANLAAGEERPSAFTWFHPVPPTAQVEVELVTDPFDPTNVLPKT